MLIGIPRETASSMTALVHPPEQVTRKALVAVARAQINGRLPGCHDVAVKRHMSTLAEGRSVFIDRLIGYWFERLAGERVVSLAQFSALGGFSLKRLTATQNEMALAFQFST